MSDAADRRMLANLESARRPAREYRLECVPCGRVWTVLRKRFPTRLRCPDCRSRTWTAEDVELVAMIEKTREASERSNREQLAEYLAWQSGQANTEKPVSTSPDISPDKMEASS